MQFGATVLLRARERIHTHTILVTFIGNWGKRGSIWSTCQRPESVVSQLLSPWHPGSRKRRKKLETGAWPSRPHPTDALQPDAPPSNTEPWWSSTLGARRRGHLEVLPLNYLVSHVVKLDLHSSPAEMRGTALHMSISVLSHKIWGNLLGSHKSPMWAFPTVSWDCGGSLPFLL